MSTIVMESQKNVEVLNFAKQELEMQAKKIQEKMGGIQSSSVITFQVVVRSAIGKNTEQKIASLESEVENLKQTLEDCENALEMANNETYKSNKASREARAKIAELEGRVKDLEIEIQTVGDNSSHLEIALREAEERYAVASSKIRQHESQLVQLKQTITKHERDLENVHTGSQQYEMKVEDLNQQLADKKSTLERKEAKISYLSSKTDEYKSRTIMAEQKVSELESHTRELQSWAASSETKFADVGAAKQKIEASIYEYKEEIRKAVAKSQSIAEALAHEKRKTAALESEVTNVKKKSDTNAGHAKVLAECISQLEKVFDVTGEDISSLVSKAIKSTTSDWKIHGDQLAHLGAELGAKLKKLRLERDEAVKKAEGSDSKLRTLEATMSQHQDEIQTVKKRSSYLEVQLRTVGMKLEEHKKVIRGREDIAYKKAEEARRLLEQIKQSELEMEKDDLEFVSTMESSVVSSTVETRSVETSSEQKSSSQAERSSSAMQTSQSSKKSSSASANGLSSANNQSSTTTGATTGGTTGTESKTEPRTEPRRANPIAG